VAPPHISVVIPTHNRAWCLKHAMDSVLSQDYPRFDLTVVDDGSTDGTAALLAAYPGIRVLGLENRGVSAARNAGVAATQGPLIAFLDSDDRWLPGKLTAQAAFFESHPGARICQTEEIWMRNGVRVNPGKRHQKPSGDIFERSLALCLVSPSAVMLRRTLFEEMEGFDESLPACEDYDLWLRVSCRYPVHLIDVPLVVKTGGHPDQLSRSPSLDRYRIQSLAKLLTHVPLTPSQRRAALKTLEAKCTLFAAGCTKRGRLEDAEHYRRLPFLFR